MNVTSVRQTQNTSQVQWSSSGRQKTLKNKAQTRYEVLLGMKWEDMTPAQRIEKEHYIVMLPVKCLDEKGNAALDKTLEGKTNTEKFSIKMMLELEFMRSVKYNVLSSLDKEEFVCVDISKDAIISRFKKFLKSYHKNALGVDPLGIADVVGMFLDIYMSNDFNHEAIRDEKNQEDFRIDNLYKEKSITFQDNITEENIKNNIEAFHKALVDKLGDFAEAKTEISKQMNDYKKELFVKYKKSLKGAKGGTMSLEQEAIIKLLLDT